MVGRSKQQVASIQRLGSRLWYEIQSCFSEPQLFTGECLFVWGRVLKSWFSIILDIVLGTRAWWDKHGVQIDAQTIRDHFCLVASLSIATWCVFFGKQISIYSSTLLGALLISRRDNVFLWYLNVPGGAQPSTHTLPIGVGCSPSASSGQTYATVSHAFTMHPWCFLMFRCFFFFFIVGLLVVWSLKNTVRTLTTASGTIWLHQT